MVDLKSKIGHINIKDDSFLVVKVGGDSRPATNEDIKWVKEQFEEAFEDKFPDLPIVSVKFHVHIVMSYCK